MKQFILSIAVILASGFAFANDSSFPKITVKGIDPGTFKKGQQIKVYGKNAEAFMRMLPNTLVAASKEENHKLAQKYRSLSLQSQAYSLNIDCTTEVCNDMGDCQASIVGATCTISLDTPHEDGDSYEYAPKCDAEVIPDWG